MKDIRVNADREGTGTPETAGAVSGLGRGDAVGSTTSSIVCIVDTASGPGASAGNEGTVPDSGAGVVLGSRIVPVSSVIANFAGMASAFNMPSMKLGAVNSIGHIPGIGKLAMEDSVAESI